MTEVVARPQVWPAKGGRPRDPVCGEAILAATLSLFAEAGYAGVSIEGVAARAGVGKATVYRRYPDKAHMVVEAVRVGACMVDNLPDTGDLRADLTTMLTALIKLLRGPMGPLLLAFAAERIRNPALDEEFKRSVVGAKRTHIRHLIESAIARGELAPDADVEVIAEAGPAIVWHLAFNRVPLAKDLAPRIVNTILS
ncbi:MAG TPA: TetR/AcrR family transcriptional regulator [Acidimicrobiales bacterium]